MASKLLRPIRLRGLLSLRKELNLVRGKSGTVTSAQTTPWGYNEARECLNETELLSQPGVNHVEEELPALEPLAQIGEPETTWVSPPSTLTKENLKTLYLKI
uniref:Uncharacterized protein n=1 Tax=Cannabis sativa TaxID=3483 RepID=A0A803NTE0_CANSA